MNAPKYLIMDGRAFSDIDDALVLDTADNLPQAKKRATVFGYKENCHGIAIIDTEINDIAWECYK